MEVRCTPEVCFSFPTEHIAAFVRLFYVHLLARSTLCLSRRFFSPSTKRASFSVGEKERTNRQSRFIGYLLLRSRYTERMRNPKCVSVRGERQMHRKASNPPSPARVPPSPRRKQRPQTRESATTSLAAQNARTFPPPALAILRRMSKGDSP